MFQNKPQNLFKSDKKFSRNFMHPVEFRDQIITANQNLNKRQILSFSSYQTHSFLRKQSPVQQKKNCVQSGLNLHHRYTSKGDSHSKQKSQAQKSSILKRRASSESKAFFSKQNTEKNLNQGKLKINFTKVFIEDLKKSVDKVKKSTPRYSSCKITSKSVQLRQRKIITKQKLVQACMQKLKPSFKINEVKFFNNKKSSSTQKCSNQNSSHLRINLQNTPKLESRIAERISKLNPLSNQTLMKILKKIQEPLNSYSDYIKGSGQTKYEIKLNFLKQYCTITKRSDIIEHIDFNSLRLLESINICIIEIFSVYVSDTNKKKSFNYGIVKQYIGVFFQTYSKIKNQFIVCQILFKTVMKKLAQYFLMQRIVFYWIHIISEQKINQDLSFMKKILTFLKLTQEFLTFINNMLLEERKNSKSASDTLIDTLKSLRITREIDKRLPSLKQILQSMNLIKCQENTAQFSELAHCLFELLSSIDQDQNFDILSIFKLEQYFNWTILRIPPLFFLPQNASKPYTLVIDLDQTLIHYNQQTRILKYRPYMDRFLASMQKYFELIVFSSYPKDRTDIIVKEIERDDQIFSYRLYRSHMVFQEDSLRKNIGFLGRNLQKLIFIDDQDQNALQIRSNSFKIKPFTGDKQDKELLNILDWLIGMIEQSPVDVRGKLKKPQEVLDSIIEIDEISSTIQPSIEHKEVSSFALSKRRNQ